MGGRDPHEAHRVATPLELLFDLTFVAAFAIGSARFAHAVAEGHYAAGLIGFGFASFAICCLDQFFVVRVGLRHRRLDIPRHHHDADERRARPGDRPTAHV